MAKLSTNPATMLHLTEDNLIQCTQDEVSANHGDEVYTAHARDSIVEWGGLYYLVV